MSAIYRGYCPSCGGPISVEELENYGMCHKCFVRYKERGEIRGLLKEVIDREKFLRKLEELFEKTLSSKPWSVQKAWALRILRSESFAIIAPTGVGKTTLGTAMASLLGSMGHKSYIILPTTSLVEMVYKKANKFAEAIGNVRVVAIHSRMSPALRREAIRKIEEGDFDILISTSRFLVNNLEIVKGKNFRLIFVDDVDAVLKSPKNVDRILMLLGYSQDEIDEAYNLGFEERRVLNKLSRTNDVEKRLKLLMRLEEIRMRLNALRDKARGKSVVISSATGRARGRRVDLFRTLLGFEVGRARIEGLRRVIDTYYITNEKREELVKLIEKLKNGILVFVPIDMGNKGAEELKEFLKTRGIRVEVATHENIELMEKGEVDVLVGVAIYYGTLVRGIDLPAVIKYAIFYSPPYHKFKINLEKIHPIALMRLIAIISRVFKDQKMIALLASFRKKILNLSSNVLSSIVEKYERGEEDELVKLYAEGINEVKKVLVDEEKLKKLVESGELVVREENGERYILIPDVSTYVQASGRTSRMYPGGITTGLSIVLTAEEERPLLNALIRRMKVVVEDVEWKDLKKMIKSGELDDIIRKIEEERKKVKDILEGRVKPEEVKELVKTKLFIVESPNKARTIANFFGKPSVRRIGDVRVYEVTLGDVQLYVVATGGHVNDLVSDTGFHGVEISEGLRPVYTTIKRCMLCGHQFSEDVDYCPRCGFKYLRKSDQNIEVVRRLAEEAEEVLIGTDPDTEGEKIAFDIREALVSFQKFMNKRIVRAEFHEVTRRAILEALKNPREFNMSRVLAQTLRRIEDRMIGFTLSPKLWCDFWFHYQVLKARHSKRGGSEVHAFVPNRNLSAGRVQTPVLRWVIERFCAYLSSLSLLIKLRDFEKSIRIDEKKVEEILSNLKLELEELVKTLKNKKIVFELTEEGEEEINPLPPFTTDTMLEEANRTLRIDIAKIMSLAQDLFEMGFITYHRTDSTRVSDAGIKVAEEWLKEKGLPFQPRRWGEGGAHEAIRPTRPLDAQQLRSLIEEGVITPPSSLNKYHFSLYDLIFKRFMASQMPPAKVKYKKYKMVLEVNGTKTEIGELTAYKVLEKGFLEVYEDPRVRDKLIEVSQQSEIEEVRISSEVYPFTQADIIKMMKERGIGRPSTYAKIVETLFKRKYVTEGKNTKWVIPTDKGRYVYYYLFNKFRSMVSEERTRELEKKMDEIEQKPLEISRQLYTEESRSIYEEVKDIPFKPYPLSEEEFLTCKDVCKICSALTGVEFEKCKKISSLKKSKKSSNKRRKKKRFLGKE